MVGENVFPSSSDLEFLTMYHVCRLFKVSEKTGSRCRDIILPDFTIWSIQWRPSPTPHPPDPYLLKSDCVLLSVHPMNDCMQQRGASDCAITCSAT